MNSIQAVLTIIGALVAIAVVAGGLFSVARNASKDATITTLTKQRDDYLSRLNYIEPRFDQIERENKLLLEMHNPADQIRKLGEQEQENHNRTVQLLEAQREHIEDVHRYVVDRRREDREARPRQ